jgi:hypothetical protein
MDINDYQQNISVSDQTNLEKVLNSVDNAGFKVCINRRIDQGEKYNKIELAIVYESEILEARKRFRDLVTSELYLDHNAQFTYSSYDSQIEPRRKARIFDSYTKQDRFMFKIDESEFELILVPRKEYLAKMDSEIKFKSKLPRGIIRLYEVIMKGIDIYGANRSDREELTVERGLDRLRSESLRYFGRKDDVVLPSPKGVMILARKLIKEMKE